MSRFLKQFVPFFVLVAIALAGCGEISSSDSPAVPPPGGGDDNVIQIPTDVVPGTIRVQAVQGTLVDLGDLVGSPVETWWYTKAYGINDDGIVVGQSNKGDVVKAAFSWDPSTGFINYLGIHPDYIYSKAVKINQNRQIIGYSSNGIEWPNEKETRAFFYDLSEPILADRFIDLFPPNEIDGFSKAVSINNNGDVALTVGTDASRRAYAYLNSDSSYRILGRILGESSEAVAINNNRQAIVNSGNTVVYHDLNINAIESLNHLPGATQTRAVAINDSGKVVGVSGNLGFFWSGGAMYPIGHIGGGSSEAVAINNNNQVAGNSTLAGGASRAIVWSIVNGRGQIMNLGTLGGANSYATGINEAGQVVGYSETGTTYTEGSISVNEVRAFLWSDGVMYDLGVHDDFYNYPFVKPFPFSEGVAINNNGEIAGNSHSINSHFRGFYLQPTLP